MIAKRILCSNGEEIETAETTGIKTPEPEFYETKYLFRMAAVVDAYRNNEGDIVLNVNESTSFVKFDKQLWDKLEEHLKDL